jgi:hypothetical protein
VNRRRVALAVISVALVTGAVVLVAWNRSQSENPSGSPITVDEVEAAAAKLGPISYAGHPKDADFDLPPNAPPAVKRTNDYVHDHLAGQVNVATDDGILQFVVLDSPSSATQVHEQTGDSLPNMRSVVHENVILLIYPADYADQHPEAVGALERLR